MTKDEIKSLTHRMYSHTEVNDIAVCVITARELQNLLEAHNALELILTDLEKIPKSSGIVGNCSWSLHDAITKAKSALNK
jgi:hypothetical protein